MEAIYTITEWIAKIPELCINHTKKKRGKSTMIKGMGKLCLIGVVAILGISKVAFVSDRQIISIGWGETNHLKMSGFSLFKNIQINDLAPTFDKNFPFIKEFSVLEKFSSRDLGSNKLIRREVESPAINILARFPNLLSCGRIKKGKIETCINDMCGSLTRVFNSEFENRIRIKPESCYSHISHKNIRSQLSFGCAFCASYDAISINLGSTSEDGNGNGKKNNRVFKKVRYPALWPYYFLAILVGVMIAHVSLNDD